jgi:hypothetical protein
MRRERHRRYRRGKRKQGALHWSLAGTATKVARLSSMECPRSAHIQRAEAPGVA